MKVKELLKVCDQIEAMELMLTVDMLDSGKASHQLIQTSESRSLGSSTPKAFDMNRWFGCYVMDDTGKECATAGCFAGWCSQFSGDLHQRGDNLYTGKFSDAIFGSDIPL